MQRKPTKRFLKTIIKFLSRKDNKTQKEWDILNKAKIDINI